MTDFDIAPPAALSPDPLTAARALDAADPLAAFRTRFAGIDDGTSAVTAYFDGNSLGRPTRASIERIQRFLVEGWGDRLIRGWDEEWMELPFAIGDDLGRAALGAAPGQTFIGDSTTVLLYKLARAAVDSLPERSEIVLDTDNFPTDRYLLDGIARERGLRLVWIEADTEAGVTPEQVAAVVGPQTALVVLSHVAYRSGFLAELHTITRIVHDAGALVLWDLCHSAGSVPIQLDEAGVDLAVGCTYKYLNGGPGSPAFGYVNARLIPRLTQPIQGWMGAGDVFLMGPEYVPADNIRRFLSGTPPIVGMLAMRDTVAMIEEAGMDAVRAKSVALTEFTVALADEWLTPLGVTLASPRDPERRGGHITLSHPAMREVTALLWQRDVIPDYRDPDGLRVGLSPLSTSFEEVCAGMAAVRDALGELTHD
ncbi:Kynureninase [Leifsonia sp. 98AMF]|uniref:kynureninase n=1 Tax=unclassified Leifsonia TaxID=2663824 RepID=UPI0008792434|nr:MULTISPECIES: aminotransferase class V-fold PLP-dependent enzyme [unclassified Leifsonia]SDH67724.1 Kynureninase [Leifsonia sp. 197AMF]SDI71993.1 Kynureninase [Leifsonia sp. 466MF]SDK17477.1 Kynureninase [Leifsonia sp. 157MF]SDN74764.1 Kynureninase [Leifsonia sp. 509MF]SEN33478.1 Kynureninase [Leifsonia sp. 467MF]